MSYEHGFYEAMLASMKYEAERGRVPKPTLNVGLAKAISEFRGEAAVGAAFFARSLGATVPAREVLAAHKGGTWVGFTDDGYCWATSEPL